MKILNAEKTVGIETFFTPFEGINGKLRTKPEDFIVKEISLHPIEKEDGRFAIADVTAINWETNALVRELSDRLHVSRQRIGFAGTKDKRAKTTRLMSFYNIPVDKLSDLKISDVTIDNIYRSHKGVKIGTLSGNKFEIIVRGPKEKNFDNVGKIFSQIEENTGFPNFYGIQRFGAVRPITHIVGRFIVKNEFENAVMSYVANPLSSEDDDISNMRKKLEETNDFAWALKHYPDVLNFEKAMLNKLVVNPKDFVSALKELPKNLLTMFIYAYQSYLFNKILSQRIKKGLPLNQAIVGDIILPFRNGMFDENGIFVKENNIDKVNKQISRGKAFVSGVLFGYESIFSKGEMGEIEHKIIESEKFDHRDFIIPEIPFISSSGSRRSLLAPVKDFNYKILDDEKSVQFNFELQKGCYATSLLREFMKSDNIKNY